MRGGGEGEEVGCRGCEVEELRGGRTVGDSEGEALRNVKREGGEGQEGRREVEERRRKGRGRALHDGIWLREEDECKTGEAQGRGEGKED